MIGRMPGEILKGHLDMLLLSTLLGAPAHGYAVVERLAEASEGAFELGEGTVYPALRRLEKAGLLRSSWTTVSGRDRRVYELTAKGGKALAKQRKDWELFSRGVRRTLEAS
jgi:DNA-binding PadR family transcriptional regulator